MTEDQRKAAEAADLADALVLLGVLLVGASVWIMWGWAAAAAYAGTVLILFGVVMAYQRGRK